MYSNTRQRFSHKCIFPIINNWIMEIVLRVLIVVFLGTPINYFLIYNLVLVAIFKTKF